MSNLAYQFHLSDFLDFIHELIKYGFVFITVYYILSQLFLPYRAFTLNALLEYTEELKLIFMLIRIEALPYFIKLDFYNGVLELYEILKTYKFLSVVGVIIKSSLIYFGYPVFCCLVAIDLGGFLGVSGCDSMIVAGLEKGVELGLICIKVVLNTAVYLAKNFFIYYYGEINSTTFEVENSPTEESSSKNLVVDEKQPPKEHLEDDSIWYIVGCGAVLVLAIFRFAHS